MEGIVHLLKFKPPKVIKTEMWQADALDCIAKLVDGTEHKGSIFRCFKKDPRTAKIALIDCLELSKPHALYFFKVYSQLKKKV